MISFLNGAEEENQTQHRRFISQFSDDLVSWKFRSGVVDMKVNNGEGMPLGPQSLMVNV